jgi:hypothetical protein
MNLTWQDLTALGIVVAAVLYLLVRVWRRRDSKRSPGCSGCPGCGSGEGEKPLVTLDP